MSDISHGYFANTYLCLVSEYSSETLRNLKWISVSPQLRLGTLPPNSERASTSRKSQASFRFWVFHFNYRLIRTLVRYLTSNWRVRTLHRSQADLSFNTTTIWYRPDSNSRPTCWLANQPRAARPKPPTTSCVFLQSFRASSVET